MHFSLCIVFLLIFLRLLDLQFQNRIYQLVLYPFYLLFSDWGQFFLRNFEMGTVPFSKKNRPYFKKINIHNFVDYMPHHLLLSRNVNVVLLNFLEILLLLFLVLVLRGLLVLHIIGCNVHILLLLLLL